MSGVGNLFSNKGRIQFLLGLTGRMFYLAYKYVGLQARIQDFVLGGGGSPGFIQEGRGGGGVAKCFF